MELVRVDVSALWAFVLAKEYLITPLLLDAPPTPSIFDVSQQAASASVLSTAWLIAGAALTPLVTGTTQFATAREFESPHTLATVVGAAPLWLCWLAASSASPARLADTSALLWLGGVALPNVGGLLFAMIAVRTAYDDGVR